MKTAYAIRQCDLFFCANAALAVNIHRVAEEEIEFSSSPSGLFCCVDISLNVFFTLRK